MPPYAKVHCISHPPSPTRHLIQSVAIHIHNHGTAFERELVRRVHSNPKWEFLLKEGSDEHTYLRWCVLVLGNNERFSSYSLLPFQFTAGGDWYLPPPVYNEAQVNQRLDEKIALLNKAKSESVKRSAEETQAMEERAKRRRAVQGYA